MNIKWMRRIDYWAGIPLCFLGTLVLRLVSLFRARPEAGAPKRVLFLEMSEMGSAIVSDPAMRHLRDTHGAELHFAIFRKNAPSLRLLGTVPDERIFEVRADGILNLARDSWRLLRYARRQGIDTVIDLEHFSRYTALLTGFSGARTRLGFHALHDEGLYRGGFLTHRVPYNPHQHVSKNFMALALAADQPPGIVYPKRIIEDVRLARRETSAEEIAHARSVVREAGADGDAPLVLVNANASDLLPQRRWASDSYARLIGLLLAHRDDVVVALTGSPAERDGIETLRRAVDDARCVNVAGRFRLTEMPGLYEAAAFMISNDSGAAHFAAVTSLETFILYGPETPAVFGSLGKSTPIYAGLACSPCVSAANHRETACLDNVCLQVITPDQVFETIRPALDGATNVLGKATERLRESGKTVLDRLVREDGLEDGCVFVHEAEGGACAVALVCQSELLADAEEFQEFGAKLALDLFSRAPVDEGSERDLASYVLEDEIRLDEQWERFASRFGERVSLARFARFRSDGDSVVVQQTPDAHAATLLEFAGALSPPIPERLDVATIGEARARLEAMGVEATLKRFALVEVHR